jgi:hypothetical protein
MLKNKKKTPSTIFKMVEERAREKQTPKTNLHSIKMH